MSEGCEKKMGSAGTVAEGAAVRGASGSQPAKAKATPATHPAASSSAARRPGAKKKERRPLHAIAQAVVRFGATHSRLAALGGCVAAVGMVALLVWFMVFSGMAEPPQFVYASF